MVEIQNLTKYYGNKAALKGISFTIKENEVLGFLGPNGAGKTTSFYMTVGLSFPPPAAASRSRAMTSPSSLSKQSDALAFCRRSRRSIRI